MKNESKPLILKWSQLSDLNRRPTVYKTAQKVFRFPLYLHIILYFRELRIITRRHLGDFQSIERPSTRHSGVTQSYPAIQTVPMDVVGSDGTS